MLPEADFDLLLACVVWAADASSASQVSAKAAAINDWSRFAKSAHGHGMAPMVAAALGGAEITVPEPLANAFQDNARRVLVLSSELVRITQLLQSGKISVLAMKGPILAHSIYRDPAHRAFQDLDLLVPRSQSDDALSVLERDGYLETGGQGIRDARRRMRTWTCEISLRHPVRRTWIDLHWSPLPPHFPARIPFEDIRANSIAASINGIPIPTLALEDHLVYLAAHAAKHAWENLSAFADITCLLRQPGLDLDQARRRADRWGAGKMLDFALSTIPIAPRANLPDLRILWKLSPTAVRWFTYAASRTLVSTETDWETMPEFWSRYPVLQCAWRLFHLAARLKSS